MANTGWSGGGAPSWATTQAGPKITPSDVTAGTKGKIINSQNVVIDRRPAPANPKFQGEQ